eukprot:10589173-Ditylum_brightwellii.AAC.1
MELQHTSKSEISNTTSKATNSETIYLVTDGGETTGIGYYSWVAATVCNILIKAKGHAPGP